MATQQQGQQQSQKRPQSMRDVLNQPLDQFAELVQALFLSFGPNAKYAAPPSIDALLECDASLAAACRLARTHQIKQRRIESLQDEIISLERSTRDIASTLLQHKQELDAIIREGDIRVKAIEVAEKAAVPYDTILAYASNLAPMTSAPITDSNPGPKQPAPVAFQPPFPDDAMLRRGALGSKSKMLPEIYGETRAVGADPVSPIGPPKTAAAVNKPNPYQQGGHYRPPPTAQDLWDLDLNPDL